MNNSDLGKENSAQRRGSGCGAGAWWLGLALLVGLTACGGGGGAPTVATPPSNGGGGGNTVSLVPPYEGNPASSPEIERFQTEFFDKLRGQDRCGQCHGANDQVPTFVRADDVNLAYQVMIDEGLVDQQNPAASRIVAQVAGGHNCWLTNNDRECANAITGYINDWLNPQSGEQKQLVLTAPTATFDPKSQSQSKLFPATPPAGFTAVHNLVTGKGNCYNCHRSTSPTPQAPFFAAEDIGEAYEAVKAARKIDLNIVANSRLVVRLREESHNCWSPSCAADANEMQSAIDSMAAGIQAIEVDPRLATSMGMAIGDGIPTSAEGRFDDHVIALYRFTAGTGNVVNDLSEVDGDSRKVHMTLSGDYKWLPGGGIEFRNGRAQATTTASKKLADQIKATGQYSIEAWVTPANVAQENRIIAAYSGGPGRVNAALQQTEYTYQFFNRTTATGATGAPALMTGEDAEALRQHVVLTYDRFNGGRKIYVNGQLVGQNDPQAADPAEGLIRDWDSNFALVVGSDLGGAPDTNWQGQILMLAIHNRALTLDQVVENRKAEPGEEYFVLFPVSAISGVPQSFVKLTAKQFDPYSYLFSNPEFISLDLNAQFAGEIKGIRIAVNGQVADTGQAFSRIDTDLRIDGDRQADEPPIQKLYLSSNRSGDSIAAGTIIASENGIENDTFFLTFEKIGSSTGVTSEPGQVTGSPVLLAPEPAVPADNAGVRTFDAINASMARVTQQPPAAVASTYATLRAKLPAVPNASGFLSSHQASIAQLAFAYCHALVDNNKGYFPGFNFNTEAKAAFSSQANRDLAIDPLLNRLLGSQDLTSQPDRTAVEGELNNLITRLIDCGGASTCPAGRTETVVKAVCSAAIGNAALLLQ